MSALPTWSRLRLPLLLFGAAAVVYSLFAWERLKGPSEDNHFVYLAQSYLSGTLEMKERPPHGNDWASYEILTLESGQELRGTWLSHDERKFRDLHGRVYVIERSEYRGYIRGIPQMCPEDLPPPEERTSRTQRRCAKYYVSFPPMPAVLMMPGVALLGQKFNDVWFTIFFAACNVALVFVLLRRLSEEGRSRRSTTDNLWITAFFGAGSVHLWCSVMGQVWFTALVVGVTFTLLYVLAAMDARHPFLAGLALACGFATRTPLLFSVVFFAYFFFVRDGKLRSDIGRSREFWRDGVLFAAAPLVVGVLLMLANHARFDSLSEFGHSYLAHGQLGRIRDYGLFNVHFVSRNLASMFVLLPKLQPEAPFIIISRHGLALWVTMPALLYVVWPRPRDTVEAATWHRACWLTVAAIAAPHIFYQNTGWEQFGYRFSMDYLVYLTVLLAIGNRKLSGWFKLAVLGGVVVNSFGAITFKRAQRFYANWLLEE